MTNTQLKTSRADGGEISYGRIKEIADNPYGDEEKHNLVKSLLAAETELQERRNADIAEVVDIIRQGRKFLISSEEGKITGLEKVGKISFC
ncbi:TPA: hypothetical protein ACOVJJ_004464 [Klebsiella oxytoca]